MAAPLHADLILKMHGTGTGIVFNDFDAAAISWAMRTALDWHAQPALWLQLVRNAMAEDFSWTHQVREYEALYRQLAGDRDGSAAAST